MPSDNYIELVEAFFPTKSDALAYYAGNATKPARAARVVINFGGHKVPTTQNFVVSPLPISKDTTIRPLTERYLRPVIPHNARTMQPSTLVLFHGALVESANPHVNVAALFLS